MCSSTQDRKQDLHCNWCAKYLKVNLIVDNKSLICAALQYSAWEHCVLAFVWLLVNMRYPPKLCCRPSSPPHWLTHWLIGFWSMETVGQFNPSGLSVVFIVPMLSSFYRVVGLKRCEGGWRVSSNILMYVRTQGFPEEHSFVTRSSTL